jgi:ABC-2 type transport system ATP-binding protein
MRLSAPEPGSLRLQNVSMYFKTFERRSGLWGAVRDLLRREYTLVKALDGISLEIRKGEVVGYIGPNGAGKSTTLKVIAGVLHPTAGDVRVNGLDPWTQREEHCRLIGVLFGHRSQLGWNLPVLESFRFLRDIYGVSRNEFERRLDALGEALDLEPLLRLPVRELSLGQRTRCELAAVLLHNPPVLLLDEPTIGLDLEVKLRVREFLKELNEREGTTVLLASHDLQDVEGLARRVIVIDRGRLLFDGPLEELKRRYSPYQKRLTLRFVNSRALAQTRSQLQALKIPDCDLTIREEGLSIELTLQDTDVQTLLGALPQEGLRDLSVEDPKIEDVVLRIYKSRGLSP